MTKQGLDASGFLLVGLGSLVKARELVMELLETEGAFGAKAEARRAVVDAGNNTRRALNLLKQEELCKP